MNAFDNLHPDITQVEWEVNRIHRLDEENAQQEKLHKAVSGLRRDVRMRREAQKKIANIL